GACRVGPLLEGPRGIPSLRPRRNGRRGAPPLRRQSGLRLRILELPHGRRPGAVHAGVPQQGSAAQAGHAARRGAAPAVAAPGASRRRGQTREAGEESGEEASSEAGQEKGATVARVGGMAFLRFTRDKRGYEHFQLVESSTKRGRTRTKVLFWLRT